MSRPSWSLRGNWLTIRFVAVSETRGESTTAELLSPSGLTATADGLSVQLDWTAPSGGAKLVGYQIDRDGSLLRSVSPQDTALTDEDVRPGKSYTYEIRARGEGGLSEPVSTDVRVKAPPLRAARIEGDFSAVTKALSRSGYWKFSGSTTYGWHFAPKCDEGPCRVAWRDVAVRRVHALLQGKREHYTGSYAGIFNTECGSSSSISTVALALKVVKARAIAGEWRATRLGGTMTVSEAPQFGCVSAHAVFSVKAQVRLAG